MYACVCTHICILACHGTQVEVRIQFAGVSFPGLPDGLCGLSLNIMLGGNYFYPLSHLNSLT